MESAKTPSFIYHTKEKYKMPEQVFTKEEQKEIIRILKGVIIYTQKKSIMTITEEQLLFEIQDSCNKVSEIIDEKKE